MIKVPEHVLGSLAAAFHIEKEALSFLGGGHEGSDGIVYSYAQDGVQKVFKILAIPEEQEEKAYRRMDERLRFVNFLGENGVNIVYPLANHHQRLMENCREGKHIFSGYIMNRVNGSHPARNEADPAFFLQFGKTIGKLHRITKLYPKWKGSGKDGDSEVLGWREEVDSFCQWCKDEEVKKCWQDMGQRLEGLPFTRDCHGFIHNDPHIGNILKAEDKIILIDFDVANYHWFAVDISIALQFILFSQSGGMERPLADIEPVKVFFEYFMKGYAQENHIDDFWLKNLDLFINYRRMLLYTVFQGRLKDKPEDRDRWKKLILNPPGIMEKIYHLH